MIDYQFRLAEARSDFSGVGREIAFESVSASAIVAQTGVDVHRRCSFCVMSDTMMIPAWKLEDLFKPNHSGRED
jgi:hypothetical protein